MLLEVGLEVEVFNCFDVLFGVKMFSVEGWEYVLEIENFNDVVDFLEFYLVDDQELLIGVGICYCFWEDIYLMIQYQQYSLQWVLDLINDYDLCQIFVQYNMEF